MNLMPPYGEDGGAKMSASNPHHHSDGNEEKNLENLSVINVLRIGLGPEDG